MDSLPFFASHGTSVTILDRLDLCNDFPLLIIAFNVSTEHAEPAVVRVDAIVATSVEMPYHVFCLPSALQLAIRESIGPQDGSESPLDDLRWSHGDREAFIAIDNVEHWVLSAINDSPARCPDMQDLALLHIAIGEVLEFDLSACLVINEFR